MGRERHDFPEMNREPPRLDGAGARTVSAPGATPKKDRDLKRAFLIFGLGALSWVATYVGMLELIEANMGDLPLVHKLIIGFSVAMLMTMIIWLLDQLFRPHALLTKAFYAFGYVFLSLISVGFGFGFYWKVLESKGEASRSAESAVGSVQSSLHAASTRLEQLQATLIQLTQVSTEKAEIERVKGTSCPNSKPGDGPRRKMREEDAQRFTFSSEFVKGRVSAVKNDLSALNNDMIQIVSNDPATIDAKTGTRNEFMRSLSRKLDLTVTGFNAFRTDPQLKQMRTDLADRAERTTFPDNRGGTYACPDAQLQTALRGVVKAIDQLPELEKPAIAAVEGSEATIEAFRRLTATFYGALSFKLPPSADELRDLQKKAVQSVEAPNANLNKLAAEQGGLSKRDYVPLAVALFVDLCLFLVSMVQAPQSRIAGMLPKMQAAERGPVIDILSRFKDIHGDAEIRQNFEIFRHVVFDMSGDYYVAVPLDAPPKLDAAEREALRVEAQLLANLFASFEKEKIFKRTMLPTTGSIQKRLARQGSKFAASEAFRVYKFTDGAWSDIILGAIMGAARRAENEKRAFPNAHQRPRPAPVIAASSTPVAALPPAANTTSGPMHAGLNHGAPLNPFMPGLAAASLGNPANANGPPPPRQPQFEAEPQSRPQPAPFMPVSPAPVAAPRVVEPTAGRQTAAPLAPRAPTSFTRTPRQPVVPKPQAQPVDAEHAARFGPYARAYQQQRPAFDVTPQVPKDARPVALAAESEASRNAANANKLCPVTAPPPLPKAEMATDAATLKPTPAMVDVTLARETATFSVPASEVMSTGTLQAALSQARMQDTGRDLTQPPPLKAVASSATNIAAPAVIELLDIADDDGFVEDVKSDPLTERDLAIISRMAPPAAE